MMFLTFKQVETMYQGGGGGSRGGGGGGPGGPLPPFFFIFNTNCSRVSG